MKMSMHRFVRWLVPEGFGIAGIVLILSSATAQGLRQGELFTTPVPPGFTIRFSKTTPTMVMTEAIPQRDTLQNWSEMVTAQTFSNPRFGSPAIFLENMGGLWQKNCPELTHGQIVTGLSNGYTASSLRMTCSRDPITNKPETTFFLAIAAADRFYVAQYAFAYAPDRPDILRGASYMKTVHVCDTRTQVHPCDRQESAPR